MLCRERLELILDIYLEKTFAIRVELISNKELKLTLNILLLGPNKSLLFLALACLKDLGVLVISILRRIIVDNYATALLRA
ncbi:hypothetical protein HBI72_099610 [Parastagonospora nodorum]|nr:hypothetical protein HBI72_099610 [Parastagonospora nodorum]